MNASRVQPRRPIRSFVLRQGRFSPAQQRAREALLPRFGVPYAPRLLDLAALFGRDNPKVVEIGSGMGEATAAIAEAQPDRDFLAIEVHAPGVGGLLKLIGEKGLTNVRIVQHDAAEVVADMIAPGALAGIHVFFPDPWPKKRHHKRRLLQAEFIHALAQRLARAATCMWRPTGKTTRPMFSRPRAPNRCWSIRRLCSRRVPPIGRQPSSSSVD